MHRHKDVQKSLEDNIQGRILICPETIYYTAGEEKGL